MTAALLIALLLQAAPLSPPAETAERTVESADDAGEPEPTEAEISRQARALRKLLAEASVDEGDEPYLGNWFVVYIVVMTTSAFLGILLLVVILSIKLSRISKQLNSISDSATSFIRIGLDHFKERTGKRPE